jgi:phytanoyl-CoA hydroxylase
MSVHGAFYRQNGYQTIRGVLSAGEIELLRNVTDEFVDRSRAVMASDGVFDLEPDHRPAAPRLRRIKSPERQHPAYDSLMRNDRILDAVGEMLGEQIRFWSGKLNLKLPGGGQAVEWHQDWAFGPATNDDLLTVGVALDDLMLINGCLLVVPGSHQGQVYDHRIDGRFVGAIPAKDAEAIQPAALPVEVPVGGISIHHIRTLHASAVNDSALQRRLILFTYAAADAWPLDGVADFDEFDARMVRGRAPEAPRLEKVPVVPWPRWAEEALGTSTSIFDLQAMSGTSSFGAGSGMSE